MCKLSLVLAVSLSFLVPAHANEPVAPEQPSRNKNLEPKLGMVRSVRGLIGQLVKTADGTAIGKIESVALDVGKGKVANYLIQIPKQGGKKETLTVLPDQISWTERRGDVVFAKEAIAREKPELEPKESDEPSQVFVVTAKTEVPVVNPKQDVKVGTIVDFCLAQQPGQVAYAVFQLRDDHARRRHPIPLAAFVVKEGTNDWLLELPKDIFANTPDFKDDEWPSTVARAWVEYIQVRYGRSPLAGVQRETAGQGKQ